MLKRKVTSQKRHQIFDYTEIAERLRTDSFSNLNHPIGVVNRFTDPTFPLPATTVKSKGHAFKNV